MARSGVRIDAEGLTKVVDGGARILDGLSLTILPGELVAIVGGSGAGKTTLLEALAGVRLADTGSVCFDGVDLGTNLAAVRGILGYVPQDDIIHAELPLERTLQYVARLRLPPTATKDDRQAAITRAMTALNLAQRAQVRVGALSGGQRKRASIAVELITEPQVFFLDEPTSGLDPATSAELLRVLRQLADRAATVVFTTHAVHDLASCDRVVFLAAGGRLAFVGTIDEALAYFDVDSVEAVYTKLAEDTPEVWTSRFRDHPAATPPPPPETPPQPLPKVERVGRLRQWGVLTSRTFETLTRNKLTLAILLGSPAMVVAMFAILFKPGAFDVDSPTPSAIVMILFWISFGAFFFGLTYGLLQICTERAILRREYLVGLDLGSYLLSKISVLLPFLLIVDGMMIVVLRVLDRLPPADTSTYLSIGLTLALCATAALALGLLTSAAVRDPSQATLALPMLCFPAVLFSGAILPVHVMAPVGAAFSALWPDRWAFEAIGHDLHVRSLLERGGSPLGPPLIKSYGDAGTSATSTYWLILIAFIVVLFAAAWYVLVRTSRRSLR